MYFFSWLLLRKITTNSFLSFPQVLHTCMETAWQLHLILTDVFFLRVLTMKTIVALIFPDILLLQCPLPFPTVHLLFFNVDRSLYQPEGPEQHLLSLKEPTQMSITLYPFYLRPILQTSSDIAWV